MFYQNLHQEDVKWPATIWSENRGDGKSSTLNNGKTVNTHSVTSASHTDSHSHIGFGHLFDLSDDSQCYHGLGFSTDTEIEATKKMLLSLSKQISSNQVTREKIKALENHRIPAGYTYLFQLVGHDIMHTAPNLPSTDGEHTRAVNMRTSPLELDTIYGGGPSARPNGYEESNDDRGDRYRLKLGRMKLDNVPQEKCPFRDIPRSKDTFNSGVHHKGMTDVLIADPRNDDNAILSQLTALFHQFHNIVTDKLHQEDSTPLGTFTRSRNIVTKVYRQIIRKDLLGKLLHDDVYKYYCGLKPDDFHHHDRSIPLEFAHAVSRSGHAMIRPEYAIRKTPLSVQPIKDVVRNTSSRSPQSMPFSEKWIVQWSSFFDLQDSKSPGYPAPNFSAKIAPHLVADLATTTLVSPPEPGDKTVGLYYRDFLRGAAAGLWSVNALIEHLEGRPGLSDLLKNHTDRSAEIRDWLDNECVSKLLDDQEADCIAKDPPLLFYTLFEAAKDHNGAHLGVLGSIITAEVLFPILLRPPQYIGQITTNPEGDIEADADTVFGAPSPDTMPQLVKFIADNGPKDRFITKPNEF